VAFQQTDMRMVIWMCGIKLQDRVPSKGLRETRIRWCGGCQAKRYTEETWKGIVENDCQARKLNREDAMDHSRWRKQIRDDW